MERSILQQKSYDFAIRVVHLYAYLRDSKHEYTLSKQLLRSGTSIGANLREARRGQSRADFASKLTIALKEADESLYWIELLKEASLISGSEFESIYSDCEELVKMLVSATKKLYGDDSK